MAFSRPLACNMGQRGASVPVPRQLLGSNRKIPALRTKLEQLCDSSLSPLTTVGHWVEPLELRGFSVVFFWAVRLAAVAFAGLWGVFLHSDLLKSGSRALWGILFSK